MRYPKRICDIVIAALFLVVLCPILIWISFLIVILDGWPPFFLQTRVGLLGKQFSLIKFRTMRRAPTSTEQQFNAGDLSRVTPIGSFLRRSKFDEIPQLWNVLVGDMSIVGPRPEVQRWVDAYPERWKSILTVRPGITDNASLQFVDEEQLLKNQQNPSQYYQEVILPQKLELYESYIKEMSFLGDLAIILKTVKKILLSC